MNYFDIFGFTQENADFRTARLLEMLNMNTQSLFFPNKNWLSFLPDYLGKRDLALEAAMNDEAALLEAEVAFANKYSEITKGN